MDEYAAGRTPNPCLRCNEKIKFAAVLDRALALGFDAVATGHYAQLRTGPDGLVEMHRAVDHGKDQSYVLGVLDQQQLRHSLFPLGGSHQDGRAARRRPSAACWSPTSRTATTSASSPTATTPAGCARSSATARPTTAATIVDEAGEVVGRARGHLRVHDRPAPRAAARAPRAGRQAAVRARHRAGLRHRDRRAPRAAGGRPAHRHPAALVRHRARPRSTAPCSCAPTARSAGAGDGRPASRSRSSCSTRRTASRPGRPR